MTKKKKNPSQDFQNIQVLQSISLKCNDNYNYIFLCYYILYYNYAKIRFFYI